MAHHAYARSLSPLDRPLMASPTHSPRDHRRGDALGPHSPPEILNPRSPPLASMHRKPVPSYSAQDQTESTETDRMGTTRNGRPTARIYWPIPIWAGILFLVGLVAAIGHHIFLQSLNDQAADNQVWIGRYSLALAFVSRSALTACFVLAYTQKIWQSLATSRRGTSVRGVDALFTILTSPLQFFVRDMWLSAPVATLMAAAVWLLPLSVLVAPTALTVGTLTQNSTNSRCMVPTVKMDTLPAVPNGATGLSLTTTKQQATQFTPSLVAQRLVGLAARNGRQVDWLSPCGPNCTYEVEFVAPSWKCERTEAIDDPTAVWSLPGDSLNPVAGKQNGASFWFSGYGDGSNYSASGVVGSALAYNPVYAGGVNPNTTQFWFGVATPALALNATPGTTIKDYLDCHVYSCGLYLSNYQIRVTYTNNVQENKVLNVDTTDRIQAYQWTWQPQWGNCKNESSFQPTTEGPNLCDNATQIGAISLSRVMIETLQGTIFRNPHTILTANTTIALVPPLVETYEGLNAYGQMEPAVPVKNLGPLLEHLSQNISLSLMSEPKLEAVGQAQTTCTSSQTLAVWKYNPVPLATAYGIAVLATLLGLVAGAYALVSSHVARDLSFSSVVRTTRNGEMDMIYSEQAGLPLKHELRQTRVRLGWGAKSSASDQFHIMTSEKVRNGDL